MVKMKTMMLIVTTTTIGRVDDKELNVKYGKAQI